MQSSAILKYVGMKGTSSTWNIGYIAEIIAAIIHFHAMRFVLTALEADFFRRCTYVVGTIEAKTHLNHSFKVKRN